MEHKNAIDWTCKELGNFLLQLYHTRRLQPIINEELSVEGLRAEFTKYLSLKRCKSISQNFSGTIDIFQLLKNTDFIKVKSASSLQINFQKLLQFRIVHLEEFKEKQKVWEHDSVMKITDDNAKQLKTVIKVNETVPSVSLIYKGSRTQDRIKFEMSPNACYICQREFKNNDVFKDHISTHSETSDFQNLIYFRQLLRTEIVLRLSFQVCMETGNYRFSLQSNCDGVIIERIILIWPDFMYYIHKAQLPFALPRNTSVIFDLNRHIFNSFAETPFVILFNRNGMGQLHMEQHHYVPSTRAIKINKEVEVLDLQKQKNFKYLDELKLYLPTEEFRKILHNQNKTRTAQFKDYNPNVKDYLDKNKCFTPKNYCNAMELLLHLADFDELEQYAQLKQEKVYLHYRNGTFTFYIRRCVNADLAASDEVLLLAKKPEEVENEKLISWSMLLSSTDDALATNNESIKHGFITKFHNGRVVMKCGNYRPQANVSHIVMFRPSRMVIRFQFRAIELLRQMEPTVMQRFLFPTVDVGDDLNNKMKALTLAPSDGDNKNNTEVDPEQRMAVHCILNGAGNAAPFVIFGPPGTGKTNTIVNAIAALYREKPKSKILVMSNSNFVCDEIALRLIHLLNKPNVSKRALIRIYSRSQQEQIDGSVSELLLNYSNLQKKHFLPTVPVLHEFRIVVCTLCVAAKLGMGNFGKLEDATSVYTHIFIDEAQSATEGESLMGIMCTLNADSHLILAGDHKQLGPILTSKRAREFGLGTSHIKRLLTSQAYGNSMIRLRSNYRSHPAIVEIFNELYYDKTLIAKAPEANVSLGTKWHVLPNPEFPIIFYSVFSTCIRAYNSRSFENPKEVDVVLNYIADILYYGINGTSVNESDIGIITPYKGQQKLISEVLYRHKWYHIKCGTAENFQGLERQIILVSFVRTQSLGFVSEPQILQNVPCKVESQSISPIDTESTYVAVLPESDFEAKHTEASDSIKMLDVDLDKDFKIVLNNFDACFHSIYFQCFKKDPCPLSHYQPSEELRIAAAKQFDKDSLLALNNEYFNCYLENQELTIDNISSVLGLLLKIEDTTCLWDYTPLKIEATKIHKREIIEPPTTERRIYNYNPKHTPNKSKEKKYEYIVYHDFVNAEKLIEPQIDEVLVRDSKQRYHKTVLSKVTRKELKLCSAPANAELDGEKARFDIIIRPSRIIFRCEYSALELLAKNAYMRSYLFPIINPNPERVVPVCKNLNFFNRSIATNNEQQEAICQIVNGPNPFAPYIIFGPPGTGKTTTIVEAILQLQKRNSRILVTAGSNSACDTVALRILKMHSSVLRIYSEIAYYKRKKIMDSLLKRSIKFIDAETASEVRKNNIVVATICLVSLLVSKGDITNNCFTHIFIDEAGASTEAETLAGIMGIKNNSQCRVILSGDHKQLGPVIKSKRAEKLGFGQSMMERLLARQCYAVDSNGNYDHTLQGRLRRNYRSHAEIVRLYNHLYYNNELIAKAPFDTVNMAAKWHLLPNANFPIIFQTTRGKLQKSNKSPSSYNMLEVEQVLWYVDQLLSKGIAGTNVQQKDIGIITPYTEQCEIITKKLKNQLFCNQIEVGSVEMFQGREKQIIIVSFVRSKSSLGFVSNPRRLNVILSRAQSLLIMIGNPNTLQKNADFRFLINECQVNDTYIQKSERKQLTKMPL